MGKRYNRDPYIGPSEAQAEALARRDSSYSGASSVSFSVAWNFHNREPRDLHESVVAVRQAYADEVPSRLHEGYDSIGEGGTPKMDVRFQAYLDDNPEAGSERRDPETGQYPALDYFRWPFRAALAKMARGDLATRSHGTIVYGIAVAGMSPAEAVMAMGVPVWCSTGVAKIALKSFLNRLSDVKVDLAKRHEAA